MTHFLFDTSALIKNYIPESGSTWVRTVLADPAVIPLTSEIAIAEVSAATSILVRIGRLRRAQGRRVYAEFIEHVVAGKYRFVPLNRHSITATWIDSNHATKTGRDQNDVFSYPLIPQSPLLSL
jgi:predicted nucleic acid-binding protein